MLYCPVPASSSQVFRATTPAIDSTDDDLQDGFLLQMRSLGRVLRSETNISVRRGRDRADRGGDVERR
jgi:hypothetical protein